MAQVQAGWGGSPGWNHCSLGSMRASGGAMAINLGTPTHGRPPNSTGHTWTIITWVSNMLPAMLATSLIGHPPCTNYALINTTLHTRVTHASNSDTLGRHIGLGLASVSQCCLGLQLMHPLLSSITPQSCAADMMHDSWIFYTNKHACQSKAESKLMTYGTSCYYHPPPPWVWAYLDEDTHEKTHGVHTSKNSALHPASYAVESSRLLAGIAWGCAGEAVRPSAHKPQCLEGRERRRGAGKATEAPPARGQDTKKEQKQHTLAFYSDVSQYSKASINISRTIMLQKTLFAS